MMMYKLKKTLDSVKKWFAAKDLFFIVSLY